MTTENLIINGVDHAKFDLEWVKKGGVVYRLDGTKAMLWTYFQGRFAVLALYSRSGWKKTSPRSCIANIFSLLSVKASDRMATPAECKAAGIEYIEPPIRWFQIDSAPEDGRIIEVADFRVVVADECPLSKHWKFWRDIPHPLNKNSMTQPPKGE